MSKVSKEFEEDVNQEFHEFDYVGRKIGFRLFVVTLVVAVITSIGGIVYKKVSTDAHREIFKSSVTYTESVASFLAKSYREYNLAEDDVSKKAIMNYVVQRYPNLDTNDIDNADLRNFYRNCLRGN